MFLILVCIVVAFGCIVGRADYYTVVTSPYPTAVSYVEQSNETRFVVGSPGTLYAVPRTIIGVRPAFVYHTAAAEVATLGLASDPVTYRGVAPIYSLTGTINLPASPIGWRFGPAASNGSAPHQLAPVKDTSLDFGAINTDHTSRSVSFSLRCTASSRGVLFAATDNVVAGGGSFPLLTALEQYLEISAVTPLFSSLMNSTSSSARPDRPEVYFAVHVNGAASRLTLVTAVGTPLTSVNFDGQSALFDGEWHLVVLVLDDEGSNNIARLFIDGQTSYNSRDYRKCMPNAMKAPVRSKAAITLPTNSAAAYDNGTLVIGHATNVSLYNLQFHGVALTQERIIQTLGVPWMKENLCIPQAASITIAVILFIVGVIVVWDSRSQHSEELTAALETSTSDEERHSTAADPVSKNAEPNLTMLSINDEQLEKGGSEVISDPGEQNGGDGQERWEGNEDADSPAHEARETAKARAVGTSSKVAGDAAGASATLAAISRSSDSATAMGESVSMGTQVVEKLIALMPALFDVFQGLNLYFRGWSWPYNFELAVGFIALPFSFDLTLPTLQIPPAVTVVLMLVMGIAGVVLLVYFARRDSTLFENAIERYEAATAAYEELMMAVFLAFERQRSVKGVTIADFQAASKLVAKLRKPRWTKDEIHLLLPTLKNENPALPLLLANAMPPPPTNAVQATILKFSIEQNVPLGKTDAFAHGLAHAKPGDSIIDICRIRALTSLDEERAGKLIADLCRLCGVAVPDPMSLKLNDFLCTRLLHLAGSSALPVPDLVDIPATNFSVHLCPIECSDAGVCIPPAVALLSKMGRDANSGPTLVFRVRNSTPSGRIEELLFRKALGDAVINGKAPTMRRLELDAVDGDDDVSRVNASAAAALEFTDVRIYKAGVNSEEDTKKYDVSRDGLFANGTSQENGYVAIGILGLPLSPPEAERCAMSIEVVAGNCMKCPRHNAHVMPALEDRHYRVTGPDGSLAYKCTLSQAHFFKEQHDLGPCSTGDLYVCPDDECGYTICQLCARKWGPKAKGLAMLSGKVYAAKRDPAGILSLLAFLGMQFVYLPAVQNALMVLACHPIYHCTFPVCYESPTASFIVAAVASCLLVLVLGIGLPVFWFKELWRRRRRIAQAVETDAQWKWLLSLDHSVLSNLYRKYEAQYILFEPLLLVTGKASLIVVVALTEANSVLQLSLVSALQAANALLIVVTDPLSDPWADITMKAGQAHQLFQLVWMSSYRAAIVDGPETETPIVVVMLLTLALFLAVFSWIIFKSVVRPFLDGRKREQLAQLHRQECAALLLLTSRALKELHVVLELKKKAFPPLKESFWGPPVHPHWQVIVTRCLINLTRMKELGPSPDRSAPLWHSVVAEERRLVQDLRNYFFHVYFAGLPHNTLDEPTISAKLLFVPPADVGDFNQTLLSNAPPEYLNALAVALAGKVEHPGEAPPLTKLLQALIRNQPNFVKGSANALSLLAHGFTVKGKTFQGVSFADALLSGADIHGANFIDCDFSRADMTGVNATLATFVECKFVDTALTAAKLCFRERRNPLPLLQFRHLPAVAANEPLAACRASDCRSNDSDPVSMFHGEEPDVLDAAQRDTALRTASGIGVFGLFFSPDASRLVVVSVRFGVSVFDVKEVKHVKTFFPFDTSRLVHEETLGVLRAPVSMSPDGRFMAISNLSIPGEDPTVYVVDIERFEVIQVWHRQTNCLAFSMDGRFLAFDDGEVVSTDTWKPIVTTARLTAIWNQYFLDGEEPFESSAPPPDQHSNEKPQSKLLRFHSISWSNEGTLLCADSHETAFLLRYIRLLEITVAATGLVEGSERAIRTEEPISCPKYSNDCSKLLGVSLFRDSVVVYDRQSMLLLGRFTNQEERILQVVESPDSMHFATASLSAVCIWDPNTFAEVGRIAQAACLLVWWPDGSKLVVGGSTTVVWDKQGGLPKENPPVDASEIAMNGQDTGVLVLGEYVSMYKAASLLPQHQYKVQAPGGRRRVGSFCRAGSPEFFAVASMTWIQYFNTDSQQMVHQEHYETDGLEITALLSLKSSTHFVYVLWQCVRKLEGSQEGSASIVIDWLHDGGIRRVGTYDFPGLITYRTLRLADGPPGSVAVTIGSELRFISFQNAGVLIEDAALKHNGTLSLDHDIVFVHWCAHDVETRVAVIHRTPNWILPYDYDFHEAGDLIRVYVIRMSPRNRGDGGQGDRDARVKESACDGGMTLLQAEAPATPDDMDAMTADVIFEMPASEVMELLFAEADKVREQHPEYDQWHRAGVSGQLLQPAINMLCFDEMNGNSFACLIEGRLNETISEESSLEVDEADSCEWRRKFCAVLWVDFAENKKRILRIPDGVTVYSIAGNSDLSKLFILTENEMIAISAVDVDASDEPRGERRRQEHLSKKSEPREQTTFSLSASDASSRTITMPDGRRLHWDNVDKRWMDEGLFIQRLRHSEELEESEERSVAAKPGANDDAPSDHFDNVAHFPHFQRRVSNRAPCFMKDCIARNVEQVQEQTQQ